MYVEREKDDDVKPKMKSSSKNGKLKVNHESRKLKVPIMSQYVAPSSLLLISPMGKTLTYDFKII